MRSWKRWSGSTAVLIVAFVLGAATAVGALASLLEQITPSGRAASHLRTAVPLVGVLGLAATAALAYSRQRLGEAQHNRAVSQDATEEARDLRDHDHSIDRDLRERFTVAASQLGSDSLPVRLAGVYAMAALADSWLEPRAGADGETHRDQAQAQVCIDVLCGYLRAGDPSGPGWESDSEVRASIVHTLAKNFCAPPVEYSVPSGIAGPWSWADINLRGASIDCEFSLSNSVFSGGFLARAAHFEMGVDFSQAEFRGPVEFDRATFSGARTIFTGATFRLGLTATNTDFIASEGSDFTKARFLKAAIFSQSRFYGRRTNFQSAYFMTQASLFGLVEFHSPETSFRHAVFVGPWFEFRSTRSDYFVDFSHCRFCGNGEPEFDHAFYSSSRFHDATWVESIGPQKDIAPVMSQQSADRQP